MADDWAPLADRFVDGHYGSLPGRVRTRVIDSHLAEHLAPAPGPLLDVGGGAGHQSLPLARRGYEVTIADSSPAMLDRARAALAAEGEEIAARVRLALLDGERVADAFGPGAFTGVLCHGVLPYLDDPRPMLAAMAAVCAPGGIVSIVSKNKATLAVRPALEGRWADALTAFDAESEVNALGLLTRAHTVDEMAALLADAGVEMEAWYGVRLFSDRWADEDVPPDVEQSVFAVELEASRRDPYRRMSRLYHLLGRKGG